VEHRFHLRLQVQAHDRLRDPVRNRGHAKDSDPTAVLGDLHCTHRRREIAPRRQPIPELVEVAFQVDLELRHRHLVDPRRSLVRLDPPIGLPHHPLGDGKRLWFAHLGSSQPHRRWLATKQTQVTRPLGSTRVTRHRRYYEAVRPGAPRRYAAPCRSAAWGSPSPGWRPDRPAGVSRRQVPMFHTRA
jgi:hypothetical protein